MRVAAVDLGSNSFHLVIAEVAPDGRVSIVAKHRVRVALARGSTATGALTDDAIARALDAARGFAGLVAAADVDAVTGVATAAFRTAPNGAALLARITAETGLAVSAIAGTEEGALAWWAARPALSTAPALVVDLGGGSVELVAATASGVIAAASVPLGHIVVGERFFAGDGPLSSGVATAAAHAREVLAGVGADPAFHGLRAAFGTSGPIRALARIAGAQPLTADALARGVAGHDRERPTARRITLAAAGAVLREVLAAFGLDAVTAIDRSLRDGLVDAWADRWRQAQGPR